MAHNHLQTLIRQHHEEIARVLREKSEVPGSSVTTGNTVISPAERYRLIP